MQLEIKNIKKSYRTKTPLRGVTLTLSPGRAVGILGKNGSGKSTLLSILAGVKTGSGELLYGGEDLLKNNRLRREIVGYVPQNPPLYDELSARDNLLLWYDLKTLKAELDDGVLKMLGINEFINMPVKKLSGGMKKRLSIGCVVARKPPFLLLDEPGAALDLVCKESIGKYLEEYKKNGGAVLLTTHDASELEICDEWYILRDGVLIPYTFDGDIHRLAVELEK